MRRIPGMTNARARLERHPVRMLLLLALTAVPAALPAQTVSASWPDGFHNTTPGREPQTRDLLPWLWGRLTGPAIRHAPDEIARQPVDVARLHQRVDGLRVTWLGHSTVLIEIDGFRVLTDPVFSERASPFSWLGPRRLTPLPVDPARLPHIDAVLISHNHHDHLDVGSLRQLARQPGGAPAVYVPLGDDDWLREDGIPQVQALDWWQQITLGPARITFVPAQHWSRHITRRGRDRSLWGGHVLQVGAVSVYHAGDTGYGPDFKAIGDRLGPFTLALLPIGAYQPRWLTRRQHIDPAEAVQAHRDLRARQSLGVHWGSFVLSDEPIQQPPGDLAEARRAAGVPEDEVMTWAIGETRSWSAP